MLASSIVPCGDGACTESEYSVGPDVPVLANGPGDISFLKPGVAVFVKQFGAQPWESVEVKGQPALSPLHLDDKKGGDWSEWPEDLRVRQFPGVQG